MQFLIKCLSDIPNNQYNKSKRYILAIEDNSLIIKTNSSLTGKKYQTELYSISFKGWHNIRFNDEKYVIGSDTYIHIKSDILEKNEDNYELKHFQISFIPVQTYNLTKFFNHLKKLNNNLSGEELIIANKLKQVELKANEIKLNVEELLKIQRLKEKQREEAKKLKEKQLGREKFIIVINKLKEARELEKQEFNILVNKIKEDRKLEQIFLNYFNKYIDKSLLYSKYYISLANYLLKNNSLYYRIKKYFCKLDHISIDESNNLHIYKLNEIDKIIEYMEINYSNSDNECAKLLTWIVVSDVAITYYSNSFYSLYGKQIYNIEKLNLEESISKYITSDILSDSEVIHYMYVYYLMSINKFDENDYNRGYIYCKEIFMNTYNKLKSENEYDSFISSLLTESNSDKTIYTIDDIDLMTGSEFEIFLGELFMKIGYKTTVTKTSGDQGIDVVAEKNGVRLGIQAKCYSSTVSNSAIQEVVAGISLYKCDKALVISNNYFTSSAIELAIANEVILWNRDMLKQKIEEIYT